MATRKAATVTEIGTPAVTEAIPGTDLVAMVQAANPVTAPATVAALVPLKPLTAEELAKVQADEAEAARVALIPKLVSLDTKGGTVVRPYTKKEFKLLPAMKGKSGSDLKRAYNEMLRYRGPQQKRVVQHQLTDPDIAVRAIRTGNSGNSWSYTAFRLSALSDEGTAGKQSALAAENASLKARLAALEAAANQNSLNA